MGNLPAFDVADVATKSDIELLRSDTALVRSDMKGVHERIDRLFITLVTGLFVIVAAMASVFAATVG
jgi:hypothetical protein